jgi:long-chain acyl-CoA synthetase
MYADKPWLKFYESNVPAHIDYPETTLPERLAEVAAKYPDQPAIIYKGTQIPYRDFDKAVDQAAAGLQQMGIKPGDRVAIHLPNCPQFPMSYYAIQRVGAIVVPCNPVYTAREMTHQLRDSGARAIITLSSTYPLIKEIRPQTNVAQVIVAKVKTYFPFALRLLFTLLKEKQMGHRVDISDDPQAMWFSDWLKQAPAKPQPVSLDPDDTAVLMYTGGTTGLSKGAQLTHRNIAVNTIQAKFWANLQETKERTLATLPLFHSYGMTTCMNGAVQTANTVILILDPRDIEDIVKTIDEYRPTLYPGVPAFYNSVNNFPDLNKYDLTSIRICMSGAAPLPPEVQERFQELTGARLVEGYGLSETSPVTHANPASGDNRLGTIGIPWPDTEAKIVDAEEGETIVDVGQEGELCVRGPQVMKGYWNMPTETANTLRPDPDGGGPWLHTGDMSVMNEDGYFRIVDRKKDMILGAGGYNIYPREIEDVLYEHPKVLEAAAAGIPVPGKGERAKAYIVLKPGQTATEEEIVAFCRENLAPHKVPKMVEFRDTLPKTLVGKVLRRELVEEELKKQAASEEAEDEAELLVT